METDPNEFQVEEPSEEGFDAADEDEVAYDDFEESDEESAGTAEAPTGP